MGHTPGPWYANDECIESAGPEGPRDVTLAVVTHSADAHADARLIAAAPELLEALRSAVAVLSGWECTSKLDAGDTQTVRLCKAALAKAEGLGG